MNESRRVLAGVSMLALTFVASLTQLAPAGATAPPASAPPSSLVIYPLPSSGTDPYDLKIGPDGNLVAPYNSGFGGPTGLARITPTGAVTELPLAPQIFPRITGGDDGNLWLLDLNTASVDKLTPDGAVLGKFPIPQNGSVGDIIKGPDGNVWFTAFNNGQVGRVTPTGEVTMFQSPSGSGAAYGITVGPDANLWFTDPFHDKVDRITPSGVITEFALEPVVGLAGPDRITTGPDGNLWYTKDNGRIGRITTSGVFTEFVLPVGSRPSYITAGPDGNLWFKDGTNDEVGRITPAGVVGLFKTDGQGYAGNILTGPDGRIWFTLESRSAVAAFEPFAPAPSPPDVRRVGPPSGPDVGGNKVVITGYNVGTATQVLFGDTPATSFTVLGPGQIAAVVPPHSVGQVGVTVVTPSGPTAVSDGSTYFYTSPACGRVIIQTTTLTSDIGPCYGDAVVIGADRVTLDLGGKRIYGFPGPSDGHAAGVRLPMRTGVTVKNGTVTGFDAGVVMRGGGSNLLTKLNIRDNIGLDDIQTDLGDGIFIEDSAGNRVVANTISHNGIYDGIGIFGAAANANTVKNNVVKNTVGPRGHGPAGNGIIINGAAGDGSPTFSQSNRVENNVVRNNASGGIANVNHVGGTVVGNTVVGNGTTNSFGNGIGVSVGGNWGNGPTNMLIQGNKIHGNGVDGIRVGNAVGFATGEPTGNKIVDNDAADNAVKPGVDTYEGSPQGYDLHDLNPECAGNVWTGNIWGSGGYSPPCTATGGSGPPPPSIAAANAAQASSPPGADLSAWTQFLNHGRE